MLEMVFNEINPYRENKFGQGSIVQSESITLTDVNPGYKNNQSGTDQQESMVGLHAGDK